jgi:hypothetical protein
MEDEVIIGANQYLYNYKDKTSRHVDAYVFFFPTECYNVYPYDLIYRILNYGLVKAHRCWTGTPEKLKECETVNVDWVIKRKPIPVEQLGKVFIYRHVKTGLKDINTRASRSVFPCPSFTAMKTSHIHCTTPKNSKTAFRKLVWLMYRYMKFQVHITGM